MQRHNADIMRKMMVSGRGSGVSDSMATAILDRVAESVLNWMSEKRYTYQDQTYNLSDSVGCALYKKGVLMKMYIPRKQASGSNTYRYHGLNIRQSGRQSLEAALNNRSIAMSGDYTLGVFAAMPYGLWVDQSLGNGGDNKRGKGWFSGPDGLRQFAEKELNRIKNEYFRSK